MLRIYNLPSKIGSVFNYVLIPKFLELRRPFDSTSSYGSIIGLSKLSYF